MSKEPHEMTAEELQETIIECERLYAIYKKRRQQGIEYSPHEPAPSNAIWWGQECASELRRRATVAALTQAIIDNPTPNEIKYDISAPTRT